MEMAEWINSLPQATLSQRCKIQSIWLNQSGYEPLTTLQVVTILVAMAARILQLASNLNRKSPVRRLKSTR